MNRCDKVLVRKKIVKESIEDPKKGADRLRVLADALENCKGINDTVYALSEIFCVSEKTILRDLGKYL